MNFFRRISGAATNKSEDSSARTTHPLAHLLYWLLPIVSALPLLVAWIGFTFVISGTAPDEMDWDSEKHAIAGLMIVFGPYWAAAAWTTLGLFVYLWRKARELRTRVLSWLCLLIASGFADYDRRHPVSDEWMLRGSAAFLLAALATVLPIVWSLLLLHRQLSRRSPARP